MRRHSNEGRQPVKARRRKTVTRKHRNAPKAGTRHGGSHQTELARVIRERDEALEQQAAITDILCVISNSPSDVRPVLDAVAASAICPQGNLRAPRGKSVDCGFLRALAFGSSPDRLPHAARLDG
jgi:hypothetical protein